MLKSWSRTIYIYTLKTAKANLLDWADYEIKKYKI